jgi:predicted DNA-binding transcriptional regulator AlpA
LFFRGEFRGIFVHAPEILVSTGNESRDPCSRYVRIMEHDRLLKMSEVMQLTRFSDQVIRARAKAGQLPGFKLNNRWRFKEREILAWIEAAQKGEAK